MSKYVVSCTDEWDRRTVMLTIDGNSACSGRLKGHHTYVYFGLQPPHGQIQLDTTPYIIASAVICDVKGC